MNKTAFLLPLLAFSLVACGPNDTSSSSSSTPASTGPTTTPGESSTPGSSTAEDPEYSGITIPEKPEASQKAIAALSSLKGKNHSAHIELNTDVYRNSTGEVGIHQGRIIDLAHQYGEVRSYREKMTYSYWDYQLNGETGVQEKVESTEWSYSNPTAYYYRDQETGLATVERLTAQNEVTTSWLSDYSDVTASYTPYSFDGLFKNPWDYISAADLTEDEEGELHLAADKSQFLVECYGGTSINYVEDITLTLGADGGIDGLVFDIPSLDDDPRYVRTNTVLITYDRDIGANPIPHLSPLENDNPDLAIALNCLDDIESYTYLKEYFTNPERTERTTWTKGYFIRDDIVYFRQRAAEDDSDTTPYRGGDDYDYRCIYDAENGHYSVEDCEAYATSWMWAVVMLSGSTPYTIDTFEEIGPSFTELDPALFKKTGDLTYEAEELVLSTMGGYFDNGMLGVHSDALATSTFECKITLTADKKAISTVDTGFTIQGDTYYIRFTLDDLDSVEKQDYWSSDDTYELLAYNG